MFFLPGYQILSRLYGSVKSEVYRARRHSDNLPVILKVLKQDYPMPSEFVRYQQEYELICSLNLLNLDNVIKVYGLEKHQNALILFMEDFGGESLKMLQKTYSFSLTEFLAVAIKIATALSQIHTANIIHKDINLSNLVYSPSAGQLKVIDFGISTRLSREVPMLKNPNVMEGTLAYISPEQTGRMNRNLDYRTDFYSLGVTFYELLTHQLPFPTEDDLELIHCHIAKSPPLPTKVNPTVLPILSEVVMKLMAKNAEDRYQSALGLQHDLQRILESLQNSNRLNITQPLSENDCPFFELGQQDFSTHFHLPQKLYGREIEIQCILSSFERVMQGHSQLLLVAGYSGVGKSVLVREVHKPITKEHGYFIAGKFDQLQRNIPYFAVVQAFRDLVQQLLMEPQVRLDSWKSQILAAVGNNAQVVIDVIPEVELILGPQPEVPMLPTVESQNRFKLVFQDFIKVFCQVDHPLVIFLDDLHWIDSASLKLMTLMMTDIPYLLLIGAYRDNEVSPVHPLMITLEDLQKEGHEVQTISLTPLTLSHLNQLVSDALHLPLDNTLPLAELVLEKTGGNPFFMGEFLRTLYVEHLLEFNSQNCAWQWDLHQIRDRNITDNVVELMTNKIQRLSKPAQTILKLAASIGSQFDLATLIVISLQTEEQVKSALWETLIEGLVIPMEQDYKFVHDRIQQATYSLIPEFEKPALHWQIGQLLKNYLGENLGKKLFAVVDHLNQGCALASTVEEKMDLIRLNLQAGQQAKLTTAYQMAAAYLQAGRHWLTATHWQTDYELTLTYHVEWLEILNLNGEFAELEAISKIILQQARNSLDKVAAYETQVRAYTRQRQFPKAIHIAREALLLFEVVLPETPTQADIVQALTETALKWQGKSIEELVNLPRMTDAYSLAALHLLSTTMSTCYLGMPHLLPLIISKAVNLSIDHGHAEFSPFAYAAYGMILSNALEIEGAHQFGQLTIRVLERLDIQFHRAGALHVVHSVVTPWKEHLSVAIQHLLDTYHLGRMEGHLEFAGYAVLNYCVFIYFSGQPLPKVALLMNSYIQVLSQLKQQVAVHYLTIYWQTVAHLQLESAHWNLAEDLATESSHLLQTSQQANDFFGLFHFYLNRLYLHYLFYEPHQALENAKLAKSYLSGSGGHFAVSLFYFYDSLSQLAIYPEADFTQQTEILQHISENQEKMKIWSHHAPMNFQHKYDLVEAEKARVLNQKWSAVEYYEAAIAGACKNTYLHEEALAYELAAQFYLEQGMKRVAQLYLQEALYRYQHWGAVSKTMQLEQKYPELFALLAAADRLKKTTTTNFLTREQKLGTRLDLATVMKASQAISGEIELAKLLTTLMKIIIQNAGAQIGHLILATQEKLIVEASSTLTTELITELHSQALENCSSLSQTIVNYVARSKQIVVLENAMETGQFTNDAYVQHHQSKSILCTPLINQGKLVSIIYLENNLIMGAFTAERVELLNLLSSQTAIAIENARLYAEVRSNEKTLAQFLEAIPVGVLILDANGQPHYLNQRGQEVLGRKILKTVNDEQSNLTYDLYLANSQQVCPPEKSPVIRALKGESSSADCIEVHQANRTIPLEAWGTPIFNDEGKVIYALTAFQDISERKQAEANQIRFIQEQAALNQAYQRFVPRQFLQLLEKSSILDVELGDQVQLEMSVLFSDIREFTTLSEKMTPKDNFQFINTYFSRMETAILENNGFIDKYVGDGIMALFSRSADDAVNAGLAMLQQLQVYNQERIKVGDSQIHIGIGINTGHLMLGTVGGRSRMDTTVISDAVNLASRVENLTKNYKISLLITQYTYARLLNPQNYFIQAVDTVQVKGKSEQVTIYQVVSISSAGLS